MDDRGDRRAPQRRARNPRAGSALLLALFVSMAVAMLTITLLQMGVSFHRELAGGVDDERAVYLAEAGLAEAVCALRRGDGGSVGTQETPARLESGIVWVEVEQAGNDLLRLRSSAMIGAGRASLEQLVFRYSDSPFDAALFSHQPMTLEANVLVDSYDSSLGTYADLLAAAGGDHVAEGAVVLSNGDLAVDSASHVYGDVHPGVGATLGLGPSAEITGTTESLPSTRPLEPVDEPSIPKIAPWLVPGGSSVTLPPGVYGFTTIALANNSAATIRGPATIVVDDWTLSSNSTLTFDTTDGPVQVYAADDVTWQSNSQIVCTSTTAKDVSIFFTGDATQLVELRSNSEFHGTIHAAEATVDVRSNFEIYGAIAARQLIVNANVRVHFDEQLRTLGTTTFYEPATWATTGFPVREHLSDRGDPFELIGKSASDLPFPADAHDL